MTELRATARIEAQMRRKANAQGLGVTISRRQESIDNFGGYMLFDRDLNAVIAGSRFDLTDADIFEYLTA